MWGNECQDASDHSLEGGIPTLITWSYGGNNWTSRKILQRSVVEQNISDLFLE
ncbi:hypothetical protein KY289_011269 [Solanum tuberosum]|nr:hypothetical protein KY289_011269 [Solanum tuberosum]